MPSGRLFASLRFCKDVMRAIQYSAQRTDSFNHRVTLLRGQIAEAACGFNLCFDLIERPARMAQKRYELARCCATLPFGNIARNRHRGTSKLTGETIYFLAWKVLGHLIHRSYECDPLLPGDEILVLLKPHFLVGLSSHWPLATSHYPLALSTARSKALALFMHS